MLTNEKLKLINDDTFQETEQTNEGSRPLEWRRSFNRVNFESTYANVEYIYTVNEVDFVDSLANDPQEIFKRVISPAVKRRIQVGLFVPQVEIRDHILFTKKVEGEEGIYSLHYPKGDIQILLQESEPMGQWGPFTSGSYHGLAFIADHDGQSDRLIIQVGVPGKQMEEIGALLETRGPKSLHITISLQTFSFEVDDALREPHHRQDLFIHGSAVKAALLDVSVLPKIYAGISSDDNPEESENEEENLEDQNFREEPLPVHRSPDYTPILKGIRTSLWVLAGLLLFILVK